MLRRFNLIRPLIIIVVAFAVNNLTRAVCALAGVPQETAEFLAVLFMLVAALYTYTRLMRGQQPKGQQKAQQPKGQQQKNK